MGKDRRRRRRGAAVVRLLGLLAVAACIGASALCLWPALQDRYVPAGEEEILLLGETHGEGYGRELAVWKEQYGKGSRDLFIEMPCYTAQYLNLWMRSEGDEVLDQVYAELEGTAAHNEGYRSFLCEIKGQCPETIFHGTDVGHQFETTGERYLAYAEETYGDASEEASRARETISQGQRYYEMMDDGFREEQMALNFEREYDALGSHDALVVGIYGSSHADPRAQRFDGQGPSMGKMLRERYGDVIAFERVS